MLVEAAEIIIRSVQIDDLAGIFHLGEEVFTSQEVSNLYRTWDEYEVTRLFNSESEYMLVAEDKGEVIGFAMGTVIEKYGSAWNYGHLLWLGVNRNYGRMRIGSRLFDRFRQIMEEKKIRMLMIDTQADNEAAIRFFRGKGFENPTDHVYMTLNLQKEGTNA